jgi:hypothetical protein
MIASTLRGLDRSRNKQKALQLIICTIHPTWKDAPSDLPYSIAILFLLVSIRNDEMSDLISMLSDSIGQITAEDLLLINLSGKGFLKLQGHCLDI